METSRGRRSNFLHRGRQALLVGALALGVIAVPSQAAAEPGTVADFNGDGWADLAIGVPGENVGGVSNAGAVNVIYGSPTGLNADGNQFRTQDSSGIADMAEDGDFFGEALTAGDFNRDGHADLAVGAPFEDVGAVSSGGAVNVIYGSPTGLSADGNRFWTQDSSDSGGSDIGGQTETGDGFGGALSAGDFDGDDRADLAVGVEFEAIGTLASAGAVNVLYGSSAGLSATNNQLLAQDSSGILGQPEAGDLFGFALG